MATLIIVMFGVLVLPKFAIMRRDNVHLNMFQFTGYLLNKHFDFTQAEYRRWKSADDPPMDGLPEDAYLVTCLCGGRS
jgi:hypothetical protein